MLSILGWTEVRNPTFAAPFVLDIISFSLIYELFGNVVSKHPSITTRNEMALINRTKYRREI